MSIVSAMDENDNLESLENSFEDSARDLETDLEKHDGIGFSTPAHLLKTVPTKSHLYVTLHV